MDLIPYNEENSTLSSVDDVAMGPRVGMLDSWSTSWEAQSRAAATYGIEEAMRDIDAEQYRTMKQAGIENAPKLSDMSVNMFADLNLGPVPGHSNYMDTARFYVDGGTERRASLLREYDSRIDELRKTHPELNLRSSRAIFEEVRDKAQEAERKQATDRKTFGGHVMDFLGGGVASMSPRTDPFNFMTLPAGGPGKTAVTRIATQTGAQGAIETVNQLTGVQEQRRLLGLSHGFWDGATRVVTTGLGAGVLQGLGEGVGAAGRRFFRNTKTDPAPKALPEPPKLLEYKPGEQVGPSPEGFSPVGPFDEYMHAVSPLSGTRTGKARTVMDLDQVATELGDWGGKMPYELKPRTDTAIPTPTGPHFKLDTTAKEALTKDLDGLARQVDPKLFTQYDKLATRKNNYRNWLDEMGADRPKFNEDVQRIDTKIAELEDKLDTPNVSARNAKRYTKQIEELNGERDKLIEQVLLKDTPDMARVRQELLATDEKMRDLAPSVSRAYARAQEQWDLGFEDRQLIRQMIREGRTELPERNPLQNFEYEEAVEFRAKTLEDKAPVLKQAKGVTGKDAADVAAAVVKKNLDVYTKAVEDFRTELDSLIDAKTKKLNVPGTDKPLDLDKDVIVVGRDADGNDISMTIREFVQEQKQFEEELEAVKVCSIS